MSTGHDASQALILAVDDNPANLDLLCGMLAQQRYRVAAATGGQQALDLARKILPDLILLDVMMPDMDGIRTCQAIKACPELTMVPVIFVTANAQEMSSAFQAGGIDYVLKPINEEELLARVATHLKLVSYQLQLEELVYERTRDLESARTQLLRANQARADFLSRVSHELRTPMNGVIGMTELLREADLDRQQSEHLGLLRQSAAQMMALVDNLIDFSELEKEQIRCKSQPMDLRMVASLVLRSFAGPAKAKELDLHLQLEEDLPALVVGDPDLVQRVLHNLLSNAIKFTDSGSVLLRVQAEQHSDATVSVELQVADSGPGVPEEERKRIIELFSQLDESIRRGHQGLGLGLAIVARMVDAMGGALVIGRSDLGGALFCVRLRLPLRLGHGNAATSQSTKPGHASARVLVIDQSAVDQVYVVRLLEELDCAVTCADSAIQVRQALNADDYELVLVSMDSSDNEQVMAAITKHYDKASDMRVIAVSNDATDALRAQCLGAGVEDLLARPIRLEDLRSLLGTESAN